MANNFKLSNVAAAACAGDGANLGLLPLLASGVIKFYSGTQPDNPDTAYNQHSDETLLASATLPSPAGTISNGVLTLGTVPAGAVSASGTAAWFRIFESNGTTALADGTVGTTGCDTNFAAGVAWLAGGTVTPSGTVTISVAH